MLAQQCRNKPIPENLPALNDARRVLYNRLYDEITNINHELAEHNFSLAERNLVEQVHSTLVKPCFA